ADARHLVRRKNCRLIPFHSRTSIRGSRQRKPKPGSLGYGQHSASGLRRRRNLFRRQTDPEKWRVSSEAIALAKLALIFDQSDWSNLVFVTRASVRQAGSVASLRSPRLHSVRDWRSRTLARLRPDRARSLVTGRQPAS